MSLESGSLEDDFARSISAITSSNKCFDIDADADLSSCLLIFFFPGQSNARPQNAASFF
jgi:hypothetical protein